MQLALWITSGLLAFAMLGTGAMKLVTPHAAFAKRFAWAATWRDRDVKLLGVAETLGAIGLIAPPLSGIAPILAPIAALCLAVLMAGAVKTHLDLRESIAAPAILSSLALFIALARFGVL